MWKQTDECANCGETRALHGSARKCRFEQPGWHELTPQCIPMMGEIVMGRRGKEVFVARRIPHEPMYRGDRTTQWGIPRSVSAGGGHCLIDGLTHWRPLRKGDPVVDDASHITSPGHSRY